MTGKIKAGIAGAVAAVMILSVGTAGYAAGGAEEIAKIKAEALDEEESEPTGRGAAEVSEAEVSEDEKSAVESSVELFEANTVTSVSSYDSNANTVADNVDDNRLFSLIYGEYTYFVDKESAFLYRENNTKGDIVAILKKYIIDLAIDDSVMWVTYMHTDNGVIGLMKIDLSSDDIAFEEVELHNSSNIDKNSIGLMQYTEDELINNLLGTICGAYESGNDVGRISTGEGDYGGKSYGIFQLASNAGNPKKFADWCVNSGENVDIGNILLSAYYADNNGYSSNFDTAWKELATSQKDEFGRLQRMYAKSVYYDVLVTKIESVVSEFKISNYGIALKEAFFSRAVQHGSNGAYKVVLNAFNALGGFNNQDEITLINAIYEESGATVSTPPGSPSYKMSGSTATSLGISGMYMKWFYGSSSEVQVNVYRRLRINEPKDLIAMYNKYGGSVTVPTVSLSTDKIGIIKIGSTINISASVSDGSSAKIFINYWGENGEAWEYEVGANYPASLARAWDTSSCENGIYKIVAKAIDSNGSFIDGAVSETITVNLDTLNCLLEMENHSYYNNMGKEITFNATCESGYDFIKIFIKQNGSEIDGPANKGTSRTWDSTDHKGAFVAQASAYVGNTVVAQSNTIEFVVGSAPEVCSYKETMDTPVSATIKGFVELDNGYTITEYGFLYGKSSDVSKMTKVKVGSNIAKHIPFTYSLEKLDYGATYYYCAYAESKMGTGYGDLYSFTTATYSQELSDGFVIEDGVLTGYFGIGGAITIPSKVTRIEEYAFENNDNITSVIIPETVTSIASHAFYSCTALNNASINAAIKTLSSHAFAQCTALETVTMSNLTGIGRSAFYGDTALKTVTIPYTVTGILESSFEYTKDGEKVPLEGLTIRGYTSSYAEYFAIKNNYTFVSIGESPNAGKGDSQETAIDISDTWTTTGHYDYVEDSGNYYYKFTPNLTATYLLFTSDIADGCGLYIYKYGSSKQIASTYDRYDDVNLAADLTAGTTYIINLQCVGAVDADYTLTLGYEYISEDFVYEIYKDHAVITEYSGSEKNIVIDMVEGRPVTIFDNFGVFYKNKTIESVTIPNTVEKIWNNSFYDCTNLKTMVFETGSTVTDIEYYAFCCCENLSTIVFPEGLETIGASAFSDSGLTEITIPKSVKSIGDGAFDYCPNLKTVTIDSKDVAFGSKVFEGCSAVLLRGYSGSTAQSYAKKYSNLTFEAIDGITISYDANGGINAPSNQSATMDVSFKLPVTVPTRAGYIFKGWYSSDEPAKLYSAGANFAADKDTVLYASWESVKYTVQFKTNAGEDIFTTTVSAGDAITLNVSAPAKTGYSLSGWSKAMEAAEVEYAVNEQIIVNVDMTFYAVYSPDKYTVTFNPNGGTCDIECTVVVYGAAYGELPSPYRDGYMFNGWYTSASGGNKITGDMAVTITENQMLCAQWTQTNSRVTSVTLNETALALTVGETASLTATVTPSNTTVTWKSSNTAVATVSNGVVTAKSAGTATITATADSCSAMCIVTVTEKTTTSEANITVGSTSLCADKTAYVDIEVSGLPNITGLSIYDFTFTGSAAPYLKVTDIEWLLTDSIMRDVADKPVIAFENATNVNTSVMRLTIAAENVASSQTGKLTCKATASDENGTNYTFSVTAGTIEIIVNRGDTNGDGKKTPADAIYLLRHIMLGEGYYPLSGGDADYNGDGKETPADAIYLLRHIMLGEEAYPI